LKPLGNVLEYEPGRSGGQHDTPKDGSLVLLKLKNIYPAGRVPRGVFTLLSGSFRELEKRKIFQTRWI